MEKSKLQKFKSWFKAQTRTQQFIVVAGCLIVIGVTVDIIQKFL